LTQRSLKIKSIPRLSVDPSKAYRLFYPQVPVIVAAKKGRIVAAMAASSCMPVSSSDENARIAVALREGSGTARALESASTFSLNWLDYSQRLVVTKLSSPVSKKGRSGSDKLKSLGLSYRLVFEAPVLESAKAYAICTKSDAIKVGDHRLFVGRLIGAMASLDFDLNWRFKEYSPILYIGSTHRNPYTTMRK
jgi:flavin reductase (DIM6/NTAB) family NADH-FMN oxidoreductase RutF